LTKIIKIKIMENYTKLLELVENMRPHVENFYTKGNKSAGTRVRLACQEIKKISQDIRTNVQEIKNTKS
jgi:hypothetical protein